MDQATGTGVTGSEAKFIIEFPKHNVTFDVKGLADAASFVEPTIRLICPPISAKGTYVKTDANDSRGNESFIQRDGSYMKIDVDVGVFQHTLTTDLLNQLLFIQEAFLRELGDIIQKITSEKRSSDPIWSTVAGSSTGAGALKSPLLYSLEIAVRNIQITATTPTSTAVRLETESMKFQFSNRLLQRKRSGAAERVFGTAEIQLTVALGQLVKDGNCV